MNDVRLIDADVTKEKLGFAIEPFVGSADDEIRKRKDNHEETK